MRKLRIAIVGATGLVGQELIKALEQQKLPLDSLHLCASDRSAGTRVSVNIVNELITKGLI
ncbi:hypothetical protein ACFLVD_01025 [Chloroflexota bacterium]